MFKVFANVTTVFAIMSHVPQKAGECIVVSLTQAEIPLVSCWTIDTKVVCYIYIQLNCSFIQTSE